MNSPTFYAGGMAGTKVGEASNRPAVRAPYSTVTGKVSQPASSKGLVRARM